MRRILQFLNPIAHLGDKEYSLFFPLITSVVVIFILEGIFVGVLNKPDAVGIYVIFVFIALIIYFSFREGIKGGFITTWITILYYVYIVYSRNYEGEQLRNSLETIALLGSLYLLLAWTIGWLKQRIDTLIEAEANEKRRLRAILQQLPVGVVVSDHKGRIILGNKQLESIIGRKLTYDDITGQGYLENAFYNNKPLKPSQWPLAQTLATGKPSSGKEIVMKQRNAKNKFIHVTAAPIHNKNGSIIAAASIFDDITQQKELEEKKDDFINMASHELKTPLTSIKVYLGMTQTLLTKSGETKAFDLLQRIEGQTERLNKLVNDLLDVSRLQTGKLSFTPEVFDLTSLVEKAVSDLKGSGGPQKIDYALAPPLSVYADKFRIYQVISNLITNAYKYSGETTTITVTVKKMKENVVVSVKDQGIGIAKHQHKKVFDRLYQVNDSTAKTFPGLGMGLYIVKEIVKKNKGEVWVESELGKGSVFSFRLPIVNNETRTVKK